jgi:hypothetical protein
MVSWGYPDGFLVVLLQAVPGCARRDRLPVQASVQPLLLWHTSLCAATYACCLSGKRGDFVSMAQHLTLCLVLLALLLVNPQCTQLASINAGAREAVPAGKQVKRGSEDLGTDTPARLVRQKSDACEGTRRRDNRASTGQQVPPSPTRGSSHGRPENAVLPGCVPMEGKSGSPLSADQDESGSSGGLLRDGSRSPGPAGSIGVDGMATQGPTALRWVPSQTGTSEAHAATAVRVQTRAKRRAERGGGDGSAYKVPRLSTVR